MKCIEEKRVLIATLQNVKFPLLDKNITLNVEKSIYIAKVVSCYKTRKTKVLNQLSFFSMLISIIFGYLIFVYLKDEVTKEVERGIYYDALDAADVISARNEVLYTYLSRLAGREQISDKKVKIETKLDILNSELVDNFKFKRLGIADTSGMLYVSSDDRKSINKLDVSEREYFKQSIVGNRCVQSPFLSLNPEAKGELVVAYSVPIFDNREIVGALTAVSDGWALNDLTDYLRLAEHPVCIYGR